MNQRNPFSMRSQSLRNTSLQEDYLVDQPIQNDSERLRVVAEDENNSYTPTQPKTRENELLIELAFERKKYAESELSLLNQKVSFVQIVIQNFELKIQQLKRDMITYNNDIVIKKDEIGRLSKEYEDRKKLSGTLSKN